jgi:hypothetical protein
VELSRRRGQESMSSSGGLQFTTYAFREVVATAFLMLRTASGILIISNFQVVNTVREDEKRS